MMNLQDISRCLDGPCSRWEGCSGQDRKMSFQTLLEEAWFGRYGVDEWFLGMA